MIVIVYVLCAIEIKLCKKLNVYSYMCTQGKIIHQKGLGTLYTLIFHSEAT